MRRKTMMGGFSQMFGNGWAGMLIGILFWAALLAAMLWAIFAFLSRNSTTHNETPLEILKRRYASGEISAAEFEKARKSVEGERSAHLDSSHGS